MRYLFVLSAIFLSVNAFARNSAENTFFLDASRSQFAAHTKKAGLLSGLGHDHIIGTPSNRKAITGRLNLKNDLPDSGEVVIQAKELLVLDTGVDENDKKEIYQSLHSAKGIDSEKFPEIKFTAKSIKKEGTNFNIQGDFHLHGVSKSISVPATVRYVNFGKEIEVNGSFTIKQSEFGIEPFSAGMGTVKVADPVLIKFKFVGTR